MAQEFEGEIIEEMSRSDANFLKSIGYRVEYHSVYADENDTDAYSVYEPSGAQLIGFSVAIARAHYASYEEAKKRDPRCACMGCKARRNFLPPPPASPYPDPSNMPIHNYTDKQGKTQLCLGGECGHTKDDFN